MGFLTQGPSGCSFCVVNYGHRIGICQKKRPHGKHPIDSAVGSLIETLHCGSLFMRGELVEENFILQNIGIKLSK